MLSFLKFSKTWIIFPIKKNKFIRSNRTPFFSKMHALDSIDNIVSNTMPLQRKNEILANSSTVENVIFELQKKQDKNSLFLFCKINRNFLDYSLLYRLTSLKLRAEADEKIQSQAQIINEFRKKILENILYIDQPVSQGLILAEKKIKEIVSCDNFDTENIQEKIGDKSIEISCFWIVLNAALAAWEAKKYFESNENNMEIYSKMKIINKVLLESKKHQLLLPLEIKLLDLYLHSKENISYESELEIACLEGLKLLINQIERLPPSSYSFFLEKINKIYQNIFFRNFGKEVYDFQTNKISFIPVKIESLSKLVQKKSS